MRPITIEAGYRYLNLAGKDGTATTRWLTARAAGRQRRLNSSGAASVRASFSPSPCR